MSLFVEEQDLARLTGITRGRKQRKSDVNKARCEFLRRQGLPYHTNALGEPIVPIAVVNFQSEALPAEREWQPSLGR